MDLKEIAWEGVDLIRLA